MMLDYIKTGMEHAVRRDPRHKRDRQTRLEIENANKTDDVIINIGKGYGRPNPNSREDLAQVNEYFAKEQARINTEQEKLNRMQTTFMGWARNGLPIDN